MEAFRICFLIVLSAILSPQTTALRPRSLQVSTKYGQSGEAVCKTKNVKLAEFLKKKVHAELLPRSSSYEEFLVDIKRELDSHTLPDRAIHHVFSDQADFQPYCDGDWMEFGVAYAATINLAAAWRLKHCGQCPYIHGFDTFTGLPEYWKRDDHSDYKQGSFDLEGQFPGVGPNVHLIKGLFNESLPRFLKKQAAYGAADAPMTFLHIDCDLYRGAAEVFKLVAHKIVPGTVIVFDDLVNYQYYKEGEMKAWWEFLQASGAKFATIGMLGPLPGKDYAMTKTVQEAHMPDGAHDWFYQSAAFVIVSVPGKTNPFEVEQPSHGSQAEVLHRRRDAIKSTKEVLELEDNLE